MGTELETDFATAMQEQSARAEGGEARRDAQVAAGMSTMISAIHSLGQRIESLEESVMRRFETLQLQKIEEQLSVIRDTESVNQKLFDSLHQELNSYRDNFVRDALQKPIIRELIVFFDDLSGIAAQLEKAAEDEAIGSAQAQTRDNISNTLHSLVEILNRLEVTEIEPQEKVDRQLHRVISVEPAESPEEDGQIVRRKRRGFLWQGKVLRPEEVVSRRFAES